MSELNLYQLELEYVETARQLTDNGGEVNEEIELALSINKENLEVKSAKYAYVTRDLSNDIDLIDKEIERLTALKISREKSIETLKNKVKEAMILYGIKSIKSQNISLLLSPSKQVVIEDEDFIDDKYKKTTTVTKTSVVKALIKKDIEAGVTVEGAVLKENQNLTIK